MQNHTKVYFNFFGYAEQDKIMCEMECGSIAVDIHHLTKQSKFGSKKEKDYIENTMAVCRDCHNKCENDNMFNFFARIKHLETVCHQIWALIEYERRFKKK